MKYRFTVKLFWSAILLVSFSAGARAAALQSSGWSPQRRIPAYDDLTVFAGPILIADQNRSVHAFNGQTFDDGVAIVYRQWTLEHGWTAPNDILLPPDNRLPAHVITQGMGAFLDQAGTIHLVFVSGDDNVANVFYARAPLALAGQSLTWTDPVVIGQQAQIILPSARITGDDDGDLFVLYGGKQEGNGLYAAHSQTGGDSWMEPGPVFLTYRDDLWPSKLAMITDSQEQTHALWGVTGTNGLSEAIYYASMRAGGEKWSESVALAQAFGFQADAPAIVEHNGELFATYHNGFPTTIWMRRSSDGGETWTRPEEFTPGYVGSNGPVSFVIDSSDTLHALFGNRVGDPANHGMWHRVWNGDRWGEVEPVVAGPRVQGRRGGDGFDPSGARAVVSQGNVLLVTWLTDGGAGENGAWYSFAYLDTAELPLSPLPVPQPIRTPAAATNPTTLSPTLAAPAGVTESVISDFSSGERDVPSPAGPLAAAVIPVILLLVLLVVFRRPLSGSRL